MNPNLFIWIVYGWWSAMVVYLTVAAVGVKRDTEPHLGQSFLLLGALVAAFVLPRLPPFRFTRFAPLGVVPSSIGLLLTVGGSLLLVWARQRLGKNWSQTVAAKEDHELVVVGPYRVVRHPMYAGGLIACIGSAITAGGPFVFLLLLLGTLFVARVRAEDALLARQFPRDFPAYKQRTWALIPFVW